MTRERFRILITGGAGYVGSHVAKECARARWEVTTFDNLDRGHERHVRWGSLIAGDLLDRESIDGAFRTQQFDAVIHMAALAYVGESVNQPLAYYQNNVIGTVNLLECMVAHGVSRLVFSSTCAIYGEHDTPIVEDMPRNPINPYGRTKLAVESLLESSALAYGMSAISLRYFNAAGADPDGELREDHDPEPHLVPNVLHAARAVQADAGAPTGPALLVFGDDFDTADGTAVRDYVHVSDLAAAHRQALERLHTTAGPRYEAFNLGTGEGHSVLEVIRACERVTGTRIPYRIMPRRPGDPPFLVADNRRAQAALAWKPALSDIHTIARTAWQVTPECED